MGDDDRFRVGGAEMTGPHGGVIVPFDKARTVDGDSIAYATEPSHLGRTREEGELAFGGVGGHKTQGRLQGGDSAGQFSVIGKGVDWVAGEIKPPFPADDDVA